VTDLHRPAKAVSLTQTELKALIVNNLADIVQDKAAQSSARASAARTLGEITGIIGRHAVAPVSETKPLSECTLAELEAQLGTDGV